MIVATPPALSGPGGAMVVGFSGFPYFTHRILTSASLAGSIWSNAASVLADGLGSFQYTDSATQPRRFYRAAYP
jgi:hypothetical protein